MSYRISLVVLWLTSLAFPNAPGFCEGSQSFAPLEEGQEWARQTASLMPLDKKVAQLAWIPMRVAAPNGLPFFALGGLA